MDGASKNAMSERKATLVGVSAIVIWSSVIGMIRTVTQALGPIGGAAMIYTACSIILLLVAGFPRIRAFPRAYLYYGTLLFCLYELCFSLSLAYAHSSRQTAEVGMVNYLWPSLTVLFTVISNRMRPGRLLVPGILLALFGIGWVLGGEKGLDIREMLVNIGDNPFSYSLAFVGALLWAGYCTLTNKIAAGNNGIAFFFILTSALLWIAYLLGDNPPMRFSPAVALHLFVAAMAIGLGYAAWNIGILNGNMTVLATASYFTPVLSSLSTAMVLSTPLSFSFWQGASMVCVGSLLCWVSTRARQHPIGNEPGGA